MIVFALQASDHPQITNYEVHETEKPNFKTLNSEKKHCETP